MKALKTSGILLLLLYSYTCWGFFSSKTADAVESFYSSGVVEYAQKSDLISEFSLAGFYPVREIGMDFSGLKDFGLLNSKTEELATAYINASRYIVPGLAAADIIYPFHFFL